MKSYILLLALTAAALSSCTTAYKTGQTPDDVYYSPTRPQEEYVRAENQDDRYYQGAEDYYTDRYIRMRTLDRYRWSALDDYYFSNPYAYNYYSYGGNWNSPWNSYWAWNSFYNPYGGIPYYPGSIIIIKNPTSYSIPSRAVAFNPNSYIRSSSVSPQVNVHNGNTRSSYYNSYNGTNSNYRYNNNNSGRSSNSTYGNSNSNRNNNYTPSNTTPTRSYTPSSTPSSGRSSSSPSSSSGSSSRPPR